MFRREFNIAKEGSALEIVQGMTSVIIVNYNTGEILKQCVESLIDCEENIEIIIVDNLSPDNSSSIIYELASGNECIKPLMLTEKTSFSDANNKGFEISRGEFVLIMNPDIIFTMPVIDKMKSMLRAGSISACGPLLIGSDGEFQRRYFQRYPTVMQFIFFYSVISKLFMNSRYLTNKFLYNCEIVPSSGRQEFTEQIPCAFYFTTRKDFEKSGMMDPEFPLFFEDVDLSYRMSKLGKLAVDTNSKVTHLGGSSFKKEDDYWLYGRFITGMLIFFMKHYGTVRYKLLKTISRMNSRIVIISEAMLSPAQYSSRYRYRKHKFFLNESGKLP